MRNPFEVYTSLKEGRDRRGLDWEESALDSKSYVEGFADTEREPKSLAWMWIILLSAFLVMGGKIFSLQVVHGQSYRALSENNRVREQVLLAPRGIIRDRKGEILAQNTASFNLVAVPFDLPKTNLDEVLQNLSAAFGIDINGLKDKVSKINKSSFDPVVIKQGMTVEESIVFDTESAKFPGFNVQKLPIRQYVDAAQFSHVLGYTGIISPDQQALVDPNRYDANDYIGKSGVEQQYESYLHGTNGFDQVAVDASGKLTQILGQQDPLPGDQLILNIDKGLQEKLYADLMNGPGTHRGAAVAIDPRNGQILALVSVPGFDNNLFAQGIKESDYRQFLDNKNLPLFNRAISGTYPPGSTSKLMTATAGLQAGVITPDTIIVDRGQISVPNQFGNTADYIFRGWKPGGLGPMNVRSAIAMSSDIFFYEVAGGAPNGSPAGLGASKLAQYFREFGLGNSLGIDLPGEKPGLVPDPVWKMQYFNGDALLGKWYLGDTYHLGIGQGDLLVTPLQVAEWTAVVANGGVGFVPQVAGKAIDANGKTVWQSQPRVLVSDIASADNFKVVQEGMRQTVLAGTARALQSLPISSAGKTGTSQFDGADPTRTHAWFTSYAPYENPQIVITVLVEAGGEGNVAALPVAQDALQWWAENRYNK